MGAVSEPKSCLMDNLPELVATRSFQALEVILIYDAVGSKSSESRSVNLLRDWAVAGSLM